MKKLLALLFVFVLFSSCTFLFVPSQLKFKNEIQNFEFHYGFRLGRAEYDGRLGPNEATEYFQVDPGSYDLEIKTSDGTYLTVLNSKIGIIGGRIYTLIIDGTYTESTDWLELEVFLVHE